MLLRLSRLLHLPHQLLKVQRHCAPACAAPTPPRRQPAPLQSAFLCRYPALHQSAQLTDSEFLIPRPMSTHAGAHGSETKERGTGPDAEECRKCPSWIVSIPWLFGSCLWLGRARAAGTRRGKAGGFHISTGAGGHQQHLSQAGGRVALCTIVLHGSKSTLSALNAAKSRSWVGCSPPAGAGLQPASTR